MIRRTVIAVLSFIVMLFGIMLWGNVIGSDLNFTAYAETAKSIEVTDFENRMSVGATQELTVKLYPENADDKIKYSSSDKKIATVSPEGVIKARSAGQTEIVISAGNARKTLRLTVTVDTSEIKLNSTYITLKRGERFGISARVIPDTAEQILTYTSSDTSIVTVDKNGVIKAVGLGTASVIVSNGDLSAGIDVIVNSSSSGGGTMYFGTDESDDEVAKEDNASAKAENDKASSADRRTVTSKRLKYLQKSGESLTLEGADCDLILSGADIVNTENEFDGELRVVGNEDGYSFSFGGAADFLPGEVTIRFKDAGMKNCRYVYLLDGKNYKFFEKLEDGEFKTDISGDYLITIDKRKADGPSMVVIAVSAGVILICFAAYIILHKTAWFVR